VRIGTDSPDNPSGGSRGEHEAGVWSAQKLAELLSLLSVIDDETEAMRSAVVRVAEDVGAKVAGLVRNGVVLASIGYPEGGTRVDDLVSIASEGSGTIAIQGIGECIALAVPLDDDPGLSLVIARRGEPFSSIEVSLVAAMGRVLALTLRSLRLIANERRLRSDSDRQASENSRLLGALRERQELLERLSRLQRAIVDRKPVHEVLETVAEDACELLGDEIAMVRLIDPDDPGHTKIVASVGVDAEVLSRSGLAPAESGISGRVLRERGLVVADAVSGGVDALAEEISEGGIVAGIAAPIHERGELAGVLVVASREPDRVYDPRDQQVVLSLAEHASLALNHARAVHEALHEAFHDSLTGLPNRSLLSDRLQHAIARAERTGHHAGILFCDLDGFKTVNDSLGHSIGDKLLALVAERISDCVRPADTVARLGGDEFAVLVEEVSEPSDAARAAQRILDALESPFALREREVYVGASIGIATGSGSAETLLRNADLAMYRAKSRGKGRYAIFEPEMHTAIVERLELEVDLKRAVQREELVLLYQPIVNLRDGTIAALEALVRWQHPTRGLVVPDRFVPLAEESGQIAALGRWVLRGACHQAALWRAKYPGYPGLQVGVNISGVQLREPGLVEDVADALSVSGLDASGLTLEITETALMEDSEGVIGRLEELKALGLDLAVDDFGIGHSSLRYLQRFPLDNMKIDKAFVEEVGRQGDVPSLLRAMVDLAEIFGLSVVAEGIERPEQIDQLLALGCELGQGHHLSEPLPAQEADAILLRSGLLGGTRSQDPEPEGTAAPRETNLTDTP
jgi:diguanylate cyclase (GGDEF)-like protein